MAGDDDWRLQGQERYLTEIVLRWRAWSSPRADWDHDHCEFCWCHFGDHVFDDDPDTQLAGYASEDGRHWVCRGCFTDFKDRFRWVVVDRPT